MKWMLTLFGALLVFASSASMAGGPYVGIFEGDGHAACSVFRTIWQAFDAWLWWYPGPGGLKSVECAVECPSNVLMIAKVYHPDLQFQVEDCCEGLECSCSYLTCHTDWVYVFRLTFLLMNTDPSSINIVPYPPSGGVNVATCEPGYPVVPAIVFSNLGINLPCVIGAETSTWGAIKGLYR